jgi:hypothetical protein
VRKPPRLKLLAAQLAQALLAKGVTVNDEGVRLRHSDPLTPPRWPEGRRISVAMQEIRGRCASVLTFSS